MKNPLWVECPSCGGHVSHPAQVAWSEMPEAAPTPPSFFEVGQALGRRIAEEQAAKGCVFSAIVVLYGNFVVDLGKRLDAHGNPAPSEPAFFAAVRETFRQRLAPHLSRDLAYEIEAWLDVASRPNEPPN